jgi:hypothetical protein
MVDESVHNNPRDPTEERFVRLEEKVTDISHNMSLLMVALASKLRPFREVGGSNSEIRSDGKSGIMKTQKRSHGKNPRKRVQVPVP